MKLGKPDRDLMAGTVFRWTGARSSGVIRGPKPGVDASVLSIGHGQVMILSTDPLSLIPSLGAEKSAWLSIHAIASDVATSGIAPKYALFDLNLPPSLSDALLRKYWLSIHKACRDLGISILGGHTGRFEGCDYTVIGGATVFTIGEEDGYVTSDMAREGDELIATKSAAIEATTVLAHCFPKTIEKRYGRSVLQKAQSLFRSVSAVEEALIASSVGLRDTGVSAMHDVTEGGILSAVLEMAEASGLKAVVYSEQIPVAGEVIEVCRLFRIDPLFALGQGSLVIAVGPSRTQDLLTALRRKGISSAVIGRLAKKPRHTIIRSDGREKPLAYPKEDPYWRAYWKAVNRRWT
jgi:hydrogenase maturation factor